MGFLTTTTTFIGPFTTFLQNGKVMQVLGSLKPQRELVPKLASTLSTDLLRMSSRISLSSQFGVRMGGAYQSPPNLTRISMLIPLSPKCSKNPFTLYWLGGISSESGPKSTPRVRRRPETREVPDRCIPSTKTAVISSSGNPRSYRGIHPESSPQSSR